MNSKELVYKYLSEGRVMQLATTKDNKPWVCSVYYVLFDNKLYWLSHPDRRHSQYIKDNNFAATAVMVKADIPVIGVQVAGRSYEISNQQIVKQIMGVYIQKHNEGHKFYDNFIQGINEHSLYCLEMDEVVLFDEVNFAGDGRQIVV